jgi:hypothetical protein
MAKSKVKRATKPSKPAGKRGASSSKKPSKAAATKEAAARSAAKSGTSGRAAAAPVSTDIRQAYKSVLLGAYMGEKKTSSKTGKKSR